jgi:hypothetical protein
MTSARTIQEAGRLSKATRALHTGARNCWLHRSRQSQAGHHSHTASCASVLTRDCSGPAHRAIFQRKTLPTDDTRDAVHTQNTGQVHNTKLKASYPCSNGTHNSCGRVRIRTFKITRGLSNSSRATTRTR